MGDDAFKKKSQFKDDQDIFYVPNAFTKLNDIYLKKKQNFYYEYNVHDSIVLFAFEYILREFIGSRKGSLPSSHHFAFVIPADWNY